ncbi:hypothetical protein Ocin01_19834 [Orchesella cincta]|uniref:CUB domain-containing protein n=1 Tax=Orchesella cincta TaxID=48709 RepID=A0A1D2M1K8_ORCCI|nr:hypothetical protein Ocin01_19834 [Orchesella cincta]
MWIIKPGNVSEFTLSAIVSSLVIKPNHTGITATCFNRRGFTAFSSVAITQSGIVNLPPTCHSLVITFYSGSIVSSGGFRARYTGYAGAGGDLANSKYYLLNAAQTMFDIRKCYLRY